MTNLQLWVRADVGVEEASGDAAEDGDNAVIWQDQSGNNRDLVVGPNTSFVSPTAPGFDADEANGSPAVVFNAPSEQLQTAGDAILTGTTDFHLFTVARTTGTGEHVIGGNYGVANSSGVEFYIYNGTGSPGELRIFLGGTALGATAADGELHVFEAERSAGVVTLRIDGVFVGANSLPGSMGANLPWTLGTGADYGSGNTAADPLVIGEHLVYSDNLSALDRAIVYDELFHRFAIPEPASAALLATAGAALVGARRRRR